MIYKSYLKYVFLWIFTYTTFVFSLNSDQCESHPLSAKSLRELNRFYDKADKYFAENDLKAGHAAMRSALYKMKIWGLEVDETMPLIMYLVKNRERLQKELDAAVLKITSAVSKRKDLEQSIRDLESRVTKHMNDAMKEFEVQMVDVFAGIHLSPICQPAREPSLATDCWDLLQVGIKATGIYTIYPEGYSNGFLVLCDMVTDGGGWTVFLNRKQQTNQEDFNRNWSDYKEGFGTPPNEYWLGLDILHKMTHSKNYVMRTDAESLTGSPKKVWGEYSTFKVAAEAQKYRLQLTGSNDAGTMWSSPGFSENDKMVFATMDRDVGLCANSWGGFWFNSCSHHFPTARYEDIRLVWWSKVDKQKQTATFLQMKIRPQKK